MAEFGHIFSSAGDAHIDSWGAGPFVIHLGPNCRSFRFEDSDRFGPIPLRKTGTEIREPGYFGEQSPFWYVWGKWVAQGRRLAADGITCIWDHEDASQDQGGKEQ